MEYGELPSICSLDHGIRRTDLAVISYGALDARARVVARRVHARPEVLARIAEVALVHV